jgi:hypothetical protein
MPRLCDVVLPAPPAASSGCARTQSLSAVPVIPAHSRGLLPIMLDRLLRLGAMVSAGAVLMDDEDVAPVEVLVDGDDVCAPAVAAAANDSATTMAFSCKLPMRAP